MSKRTVVSRCYAEGGVLHVQLQKFNEDGSWTYHRTTVSPDQDPEAVMREVNRHIAWLNDNAVAQRATSTGRRGEYFDRVEEHAQLPADGVAQVRAEFERWRSGG